MGATNIKGEVKMDSSQRAKRDSIRKRNRQFIGVPELRERWNGCSHMFVERKIKNDPSFPKVYRIGRHRFFDLDEIEVYEQRHVAPRD
jgi:hypothetical protein